MANDLNENADAGLRFTPHQQRVLHELHELQEKTDRLSVFLRSELATRVPAEELNLMTMQLTIMTTYKQVLAARVALWLREEPDTGGRMDLGHIMSETLGG